MIPSLNRIIGASQSSRYFRNSVDVIYDETVSCPSNFDKISDDKKIFKFQNRIELKNINFEFVNENEVLTDINLVINKGQTIGLVGESGSGKSTLVDLIIGLHKPSSGRILIDGVSDFQLSQKWKNSIGYVSQTVYLIDDTIKKNIALGIPEDSISDQIISDLIIKVKLDKFIRDLKLGVNTKVGERGVQLSGGQRQRIGIARALYRNPEILILDEATSALDSATEKDVINSISKLKGEKTIIMIAHRLSTLQNCNNVYNIINKKLVIVKNI
jgi:ABC-type bacteriocin/lantibiotic exporter with double-glycine peptidase domain